MQEKGESLLRQDWGCGLGDPIPPIPGSFVSLAVWGPSLSSKYNTTQAYCHSCSVVVSVRSFGSRRHLFPALKLALLGRHFRSNEEVHLAVKNYLRSLGIDFDQDGFTKLISRYDKCINVAGEYVEK
ncbi:hypothetical protein AVEN_183374-1 [Araneus ventricosus]|uniref:Uncharacterized protein n=1 Tax=Araneus ventricosus TaxID=182803 RepID=A0A4Y2UM70_ARAVE|nr:hypothetical protein AVEN_183374-1 [Araneus ventricosus]